MRANIEAWDRVGLLRDISTVVSAEGVNIASVVTRESGVGRAFIELTLHTSGMPQLSRLFSKLAGVKGVLTVRRVNAG